MTHDVPDEPRQPTLDGILRKLDAGDELYRLIQLQFIVADEKSAGRRRLSSAAFKPLSNDSHCSAYAACECAIDDIIAPYTITTICVGAITIQACSDQGYVVERDVNPGEHASHVHLIAPAGLGISQKRAKWAELAKQTRWVAGPITWGQ